ncbi:cytoplasmic tyrosine-protein kinase BMX isoform X1 [Gallus gallus]|uniref:Tyrosine-protein kinase n=1 Tax=Gallus gallus TaxID=9031 RepID=E1BTT3_CHICK|nr:cytoplasmic tyrosine-protein kinase BMX isoform X1 [Gallus gallus]XP_040559301.1 cytoplasmic tyrosine-protein kinase BMX isoform X1 [Gallus gallus]|eukprot:XP_025002368.1 cytoplasmic tyrosine-protein kinase BMX [Gallus gallus]
MEKKIILEELLLKKSQQKRKMSPANYKKRLFVLTKTSLSYYEYGKEKRGRKKGSIEIEKIRCVETVNLEESTPPARQYPFQIVYKGGLLYVYAPDEERRNKWLAALHREIKENTNLLSKYHRRFFTNGRFLCCNQTCKAAPGCTTWEKYVTLCCTTLSVKPLPPVPQTLLRRRSLPQVVSSNKGILNMAVAQCNYEPSGNSAIRVVKSNKYHVLQEEDFAWWKVRDLEGENSSVDGHTSAEEQTMAQHDWYVAGISRAQSEQLLHQKGKEGAFVVRKSSQAGIYTVSVLSKFHESKKGTVKHYHVHKTPENKYYLTENHCFETIPKLINYHQHNSAGMVPRLRHVVSTQINKVPATASLGNGIWELKREEIVPLRELGSGQFGAVHLGKWKGLYDVAVKMIKEGVVSEDEFVEEAQTMMKLNHPKLVRLYGVCSKLYPIYLVMEYMPNGSLLSYLQIHGKELQPLQLLEICYDVCDAMAFLESCQLIHRDLAARNCLVDSNLTVKLSDFGMTKYVLDDLYVSSLGTKFPVKWSAPEVFHYTKFSSKSDVWAFGILMWEVFTLGKQPYELYDNMQVIEKVSQGYRLYRPQLVSDITYQIMYNCWHELPEKRPAFHQLLSFFEVLREDSRP